MAFLGDESQYAAEASECAADQDAFWEYHDKLFVPARTVKTGGVQQGQAEEFATTWVGHRRIR